MFATGLVKDHQCVSVPEDLQLIKHTQGINIVLHYHAVPEFFPEYLIDKTLQDAFLLRV